MYKENFCIQFLNGWFHGTPEDKFKVMTGKQKSTKQTQKGSRGVVGKQEAAFVQLSYKITLLPCLPLST